MIQLGAGSLPQVIKMSCHHGLQHSIKFRTQWLQAQARLVSSASRGKGSQQKRIPKLVKPAIPSQSSSQHKPVAIEPPIAPKQLAVETKGNAGLYEFPGKLLIYQPSAGKTALVAFIKMAGLLSFCVGTVYYGIQAVADELQSNWKVIQIAVIASMPLTFITLATGPYVAGVHLHLPVTARASLAHLNRFVANMPHDTVITFTTIRFLPWRAHTAGTRYGELFRLPSKFGRIANIQWGLKGNIQAPEEIGGRKPQAKSRFKVLDRLREEAMEDKIRLRTKMEGKWPEFMGDSVRLNETQTKFFVPESEVAMKRSRAPGVWQGIWDRLPSIPRGKSYAR